MKWKHFFPTRIIGRQSIKFCVSNSIKQWPFRLLLYKLLVMTMPVAISFMVQHNNPKRFFFSFQLFSFKKQSQFNVLNLKLLIFFNNNQMSSGFDLHKQQIITLGCKWNYKFWKGILFIDFLVSQWEIF